MNKIETIMNGNVKIELNDRVITLYKNCDGTYTIYDPKNLDTELGEIENFKDIDKDELKDFLVDLFYEGVLDIAKIIKI